MRWSGNEVRQAATRIPPIMRRAGITAMFQFTVLTMQISSFLCPSDQNPGSSGTFLVGGRERLVGSCNYPSNVGLNRRITGLPLGIGRRVDRQLAGERPELHRVHLGRAIASAPDHHGHVHRRDQQHGHLQRVGQGPRHRLARARTGWAMVYYFPGDLAFQCLRHRHPVQPGVPGLHRQPDPTQAWNWKGEWWAYCAKIYSHTVMPNRYACAYSDQEQDGRRRATITAINASSNHPGGINMLFMDGSVRFIKSSVGYLPYYSIATPDGGETLSSDSY